KLTKVADLKKIILDNYKLNAGQLYILMIRRSNGDREVMFENDFMLNIYENPLEELVFLTVSHFPSLRCLVNLNLYF
ncbi:MAG: hypothetical protein MHPSP_000378, partial [Paramarteilia canceri]